MKKIVILGLSLIGLTTLTMMSFKDAPVKSKTLNENVKSSIIEEGYFWGHSIRRDCYRGRGNCMVAISVNPDAEISTKATFELVGNNQLKITNIDPIIVDDENYALYNNDIQVPQVICNNLNVQSILIKAGQYNINANKEHLVNVVVN